MTTPAADPRELDVEEIERWTTSPACPSTVRADIAALLREVRTLRAERARDAEGCKLAAAACEWTGCVGLDEMGCTRDDDDKPREQWCVMCRLSDALAAEGE